MRIEKLRLKNFRCFDDFQIQFAKKVTVLIGKNGSGKTNLITALVYAMSFPFAKNKVGGEQSISTSSADLKVANIDGKGTPDARYDGQINDFIYPIEIESLACFDDKYVTWAMVKERKGGGLHSSLYKNAFEEYHRHYFKNDNLLPIFAFFSDSYPHKKIDIRAYPQSILKKSGKLPVNFGYYMWDREVNCIDIWKQRYIKIYQQINNIKNPQFRIVSRLGDLYTFMENDPGNDDYLKWELESDKLRKELEDVKIELTRSTEFKEISFIDNKLVKFSKPLREDLDFLNKDLQLDTLTVVGTAATGIGIQFNFANGRKMFFDNLPQGYKRIFSIVFDIAYRSFILNEDAEPTGIVFIDELELHLHPALQQEVLERLQATFPMVQFIISTHSPLIISNLKSDSENCKVVKLFNERGHFDNIEVPNVYGVDYTASLEEVMGANIRPSTIDSLIDSFVLLKVRNKEEAANKIYDELMELVGQNNESIKREVNIRLAENL